MLSFDPPPRQERNDQQRQLRLEENHWLPYRTDQNALRLHFAQRSFSTKHARQQLRLQSRHRVMRPLALQQKQVFKAHITHTLSSIKQSSQHQRWHRRHWLTADTGSGRQGSHNSRCTGSVGGEDCGCCGLGVVKDGSARRRFCGGVMPLPAMPMQRDRGDRRVDAL